MVSSFLVNLRLESLHRLEIRSLSKEIFEKNFDLVSYLNHY